MNIASFLSPDCTKSAVRCNSKKRLFEVVSELAVQQLPGLSAKEIFDSLLARHVDTGKDNPWRVLGLEPTVSHADARKRYLALVQENHPDRMLARGVPEEFLRIANERLAAINHAWDQVEAELKRR